MRSYSVLMPALLAAILFAGVAAQPASASLVTESFSFSFDDFVPLNSRGVAVQSPSSPVDPWSGSFTVTFDPNGGAQNGALDSFASNLTLGIAGSATWTFSFVPGFMLVSDECRFLGCIASSNPGSAFFDFFLSPLSVIGADYGANNLINDSETGTISEVTTAVPEPATFALFCGGLAGLMGLLRRQGRESITA